MSSIQSIEVSFFVQMTEDEDKIKRAVVSLLGKELPVQRDDAEGHFGNRIAWIRYHATGDDAEAALGSIVRRIDPGERRAIMGDLESVLDEHVALYIRLSKQVLVEKGDAVLTASDPVRIRVKPRSYLVRGDPRALYAKLLEVGV